MSDTPEIAAIRAIWTPDDAPHGAHLLDTVPWNTTVAMAQSHIATLLAALDKAQSREAALREQIARDAPVIAAAEGLGAARVRRLRAMPDDVDIGEFAAADTAYSKALESLSSTLARRAATTPTP